MRSPTVLIIDGDRDSLAIFSLILRHEGFRVLQAEDAAAGYALAREQRPELVVLEPFGPGTGCAEPMRLLRADPVTAALPLLVVTAVPSLMEVRASPGVWGERFLVKPCPPRALLAEVRRRLGPALTAA